MTFGDRMKPIPNGTELFLTATNILWITFSSQKKCRKKYILKSHELLLSQIDYIRVMMHSNGVAIVFSLPVRLLFWCKYRDSIYGNTSAWDSRLINWIRKNGLWGRINRNDRKKTHRLIWFATVRLVTSLCNLNNAESGATRQLRISNCCMQWNNYRINISNGEDVHTQSRCHLINWLLLFVWMDFLPAKKATHTRNTWMHYKWSINKLNAHFDSGLLWCCTV